MKIYMAMHSTLNMVQNGNFMTADLEKHVRCVRADSQ